MAMVLVTHDLGVVAGRTDDVIVMYAGQVVETGADRDAVRRHAHAVHRGAAALDPEDRRTEPHAPHRDPGSPARPRLPSRRLPVRRPLRLRAGQVPRGAAAAVRRPHARPPVPLLVPGRHPRGRGRARAQPRRRRGKPPDGRAPAPRTSARGRRRAAPRRGPRRRVPRRRAARCARGVGDQPRPARGRDARARRRVRLREVDDRAGDHAAPAAHVGKRAASTASSSPICTGATCAGSAPRCR